jgi:hypothetical protein
MEHEEENCASITVNIFFVTVLWASELFALRFNHELA